MQENTVCQIVKFDNMMPATIIHHTRKSSHIVSSHWHLDMEINLLFEGGGEFYIDGKYVKLTDGGLCLVNSGEIHSAMPHIEGTDDKIINITLIIKYDFLKSVIPDYENILFEIRGVREKTEIAVLMYQISEMALKPDDDEGKNLMIMSSVCAILSILCSKCKKSKMQIDINTQRDSERIRRMLEYIHANYTQPLQQQEMAKKFYFSREYFSRFFKKYTGKTFKEYLTLYRLTRAERMLRETDRTIVQLAQENGFPDERRFIENFKRYYGMTPGEYRKDKLASD